MITPIYNIEEMDLTTLAPKRIHHAIEALETGSVVFLPSYAFKLKAKEQCLLSKAILDEKHKNISFDYLTDKLSGLNKLTCSTTNELLHQFMLRFALFSKQLMNALAPTYCDALKWGRTSYRPAEISGRALSKRKDDKRLHVDAFPASPVNGLRILRVFCNINPAGEPRVWHVGGPFEKVMAHFSHRIPTFSPFGARFLKLIKATKSLRSPYDHYMLKLHDKMKLDDDYQANIIKHRVDFPSQSTWIVFTDHVSHAALSGQFLLEQTFYLPVEAMQEQSRSPLKLWEKEKKIALI